MEVVNILLLTITLLTNLKIMITVSIMFNNYKFIMINYTIRIGLRSSCNDNVFDFISFKPVAEISDVYKII